MFGLLIQYRNMCWSTHQIFSCSVSMQMVIASCQEIVWNWMSKLSVDWFQPAPAQQSYKSTFKQNTDKILSKPWIKGLMNIIALLIFLMIWKLLTFSANFGILVISYWIIFRVYMVICCVIFQIVTLLYIIKTMTICEKCHS